MMSRYEVSLNGVPLSGISRDILIIDINYESPSINTETYEIAKRQGARIHRRYIGQNRVSISLAIRAYDTLERQEICKAISRWAKNGGMLQTSDRKGQRLRCVCESFPTVTSALKWTDTLTVTFAAYVLPFWEDMHETTLVLDGRDQVGTVYVPGNVDYAMFEASIKANSQLTSVTLKANDKELTLSGISILSGQTIRLYYDENMIQVIDYGGISLLHKRSGADDLIAKGGDNNILSMSADAPVTVTFKVRGLWL